MQTTTAQDEEEDGNGSVPARPSRGGLDFEPLEHDQRANVPKDLVVRDGRITHRPGHVDAPEHAGEPSAVAVVGVEGQVHTLTRPENLGMTGEERRNGGGEAMDKGPEDAKPGNDEDKHIGVQTSHHGERRNATDTPWLRTPWRTARCGRERPSRERTDLQRRSRNTQSTGIGSQGCLKEEPCIPGSFSVLKREGRRVGETKVDEAIANRHAKDIAIVLVSSNFLSTMTGERQHYKKDSIP